MKFFSKFSKFLIVLPLITAVAVAGYFYFQYQKTQKLLQDPKLAAQEEIKALVTKVAVLMELPKDEQPTVATISDKIKLKDQPFFTNAENGDKVLIYTQSRKAIIYRPGANKIIEVSTVNLGSSSGSSPTSQPAANMVKVAIYNGTNTVGLTLIAEKQLKDKMKNIDVVAKENANKKDYEKTIVIILSKDKEKEGQAVADFLGVKIAPLPEGETKPAADIFIILGTDYIKK